MHAAVPPYVPPPEPPEVEMLFAKPLDPALLAPFALPSNVERTQCLARVGRGGRVIFDRVNPFTYEPYGLSPPGVDSDEPMTLPSAAY